MKPLYENFQASFWTLKVLVTFLHGNRSLGQISHYQDDSPVKTLTLHVIFQISLAMIYVLMRHVCHFLIIFTGCYF